MNNEYLPPKVIVTTLAKSSVWCFVRVINRDHFTASSAMCQFFICAVLAGVYVGGFVVGRFLFRQFLAAIFTRDVFHRASC